MVTRVPPDTGPYNGFTLSTVMAPTRTVNIIATLGHTILVYDNYTGWAKKSRPAYFCNNFVYCQPIFIIFGTYTL